MPLRVVPSLTGLPLKRCPGIGFLSRADRKIRVVRHVAPHTWLVKNFLLRPASSCGAPGRPGTPSRESRGIDSAVTIRRGEGAQMKWCLDPRCSPRGNPACRGTFAVASRVSSTVSHLRTEHGTSLETPGTSVFPWSETGMLGNFGVASRVPSSISNFKMERGTSLETLAGKGLILR